MHACARTLIWAHALRERERWGGGGDGRTETDLYHIGEGNLSIIIDHLSSSSPPQPHDKRLIIRHGEEKSHYQPVHTCNINYYSFTPSRPAAQLPRSFTYEVFSVLRVTHVVAVCPSFFGIHSWAGQQRTSIFEINATPFKDVFSPTLDFPNVPLRKS